VELNPSTFLLEIVNFLILVWLLKRFLYRPVSAAIEERRQQIARTVEQARDTQAAAEALRQQYETRLADWELEKRQARESFRQELDADRERALHDLEKALAAEREKTQVLLARQRRTLEADLEREALRLSRRFAARFLERLASPEIDAALTRMFIDDLAALDPEQWRSLEHALTDEPRIEVSSAFPVGTELRTAIRQALETRFVQPIEWIFREDPALLSGLRLRAGPLVLAANVAEELAFFSDKAEGVTGATSGPVAIGL
jgi:F-type H+-transporting ATPase subunit b